MPLLDRLNMAPIRSLGRIGPETSADSLGRLVRMNSDTIRVRQAIPATHSKVRTNRFLSVGCGSCILIFYVLLKTLSARYFPPYLLHVLGRGMTHSQGI